VSSIFLKEVKMAGGRGNYEWLWYDPDREQYRALIYIDKVRKRPKLMSRKEELELIENGADDFEIDQILNERYKRILDEYVNPAQGLTLNALLDRFWKVSLSKETHGAQYELYHNFWRKQLGNRTLSEIRKGDIAVARDSLENLAPSTQNKYVYSLSSVFEFAVDREWLEDNPCRKLKSLKVKNARSRWLAPEELERLYEECRNSNNPHLYLAVRISIQTGCRRGELFPKKSYKKDKEGRPLRDPQRVFDCYAGGLKWENVDLEQGLLLLTHTKTGLNRKVAVTGDALDLLRDLRKTPCISGYVFHTNGTPVAGQTPLRESFEGACERAGLEDFHWHDLRHCCASYLAQSKATDLEIAIQLGHSGTDLVKRYAHLREDNSLNLVHKVEKQSKVL